MIVAPGHLASRFKDAMLPPVFATPMMILAMENAALNAVRDFLDPGETAVGTQLDVSHLAPTPVGHRVRAEAEVVEIEGSHIRFTVSAWDDVEEIGRGTHERAVVDLSRLATRLERKQASGGGS